MTVSIVIFFSILLQFATVYLAFRLTRTTGWHLAWSVIASALLLMGIRRAISFVDYLKHGTQPKNYVPEIVV